MNDGTGASKIVSFPKCEIQLLEMGHENSDSD